MAAARAIETQQALEDRVADLETRLGKLERQVADGATANALAYERIEAGQARILELLEVLVGRDG